MGKGSNYRTYGEKFNRGYANIDWSKKREQTEADTHKPAQHKEKPAGRLPEQAGDHVQDVQQ